jgi:hypothetical protein
MAKNFNIVNAKAEDLEYITKLRAENRNDKGEPPTSPKILSLLIEAHKGRPAAEEKPFNLNESPEYKAAQQHISELNTQVQELKDQALNFKAPEPEPVKIPWPGFIYTPEPVLFRNMQRYFAYLVKRGEISKNEENLPQKLTSKAINYFIKNEYPEVIK